MKKTWSVPVFVFFAVAAQAQECRVVDPELQGAYSGPCVNGLAEGKGIAGGTARYEGGFKAGMKHGKGVKSWPNGDRYEGEFVADRKEGRGRYVWGRGPWAGESYEGAYVGDKRQGLGTYRWPSGDVYRGPWENDAGTGAPTAMMRARRQFEQEARAALRAGERACKELAVGIGGRDWIRGTVLEASAGGIAVRIDDAGTQPHYVGDTELKPGVTLRDAPSAWIPCY